MANIKVEIDASKIKLKVFKLFFKKKIEQKLLEAADEVIVEAVKRQIIENESVFRGALLNSIEAKAAGRGIASVTVTVGSDLPYAAAVEEGAKPHSPEFRNILAWVKVKKGLDGIQALIVTRSIVRGIQLKGTQPHPYLVPAFEANKALLLRRFTDKMKK